jgi:hypothetical protein
MTNDIPGYRGLTEEELANVRGIKELEELVLRLGDGLRAAEADPRALAIATTYAQTAFMWFVRAVTKPERIGLSHEDAETFVVPPHMAA